MTETDKPMSFCQAGKLWHAHTWHCWQQGANHGSPEWVLTHAVGKGRVTRDASDGRQEGETGRTGNTCGCGAWDEGGRW